MGVLSKLGAFFRPIPPPEGFPLPSKFNVYASKSIGACLWFWILYRTKKDGASLLVYYLLPN